ncbi:hypothetical protein TSMEX_011095, partial [Taenia solium]
LVFSLSKIRKPNNTPKSGTELAGVLGIEPLSGIDRSSADLTLEKERFLQDRKLGCDSTLSLVAEFPSNEFSLSELEHQSKGLPTNRNTESLENQQIMTLPDCQYFTIYTCNGEQTKRSCTKSLTRAGIENDIAKSLSNAPMSLNRKRQIERGKELLRIIELSLDDFREIFNLQPMDEYFSYVLRFCQVELSHVQLQTMDDCLSRDTQTERPRAAPYSSWTQIPPAYEGGHSGHVRFAQDGNIKQRCRVVSQRVHPEDFKLSFAVAAVTCLALHPFLPNVLIAVGVRKVIWSPHRPNVTFCLATDGDIIAWTLLDGEQAILKPRAQTLIIGTIRERRVVDFSVARGGSGCLAVCWQDGAEIHWLEENLVARQEDELLSLENTLSELL